MPLDFEIVGATREAYETFECIVARVRLPVQGTGKAAYIFVDVDLPEKYRELAARRLRNPDGTYSVEAKLEDNRKSLAPFLASGDLEWNVRERA
ncbi:hypothetical protein [Trinickia violacea]|uniref:hypothetical protein n=1 Tax=Trinickia violacea TaxID=2571746 RepID=UPI001586D5D3|nr:hypothetical protein [Trinickia violacea]